MAHKLKALLFAVTRYKYVLQKTVGKQFIYLFPERHSSHAGIFMIVCSIKEANSCVEFIRE